MLLSVEHGLFLHGAALRHHGYVTEVAKCPLTRPSVCRANHTLRGVHLSSSASGGLCTGPVFHTFRNGNQRSSENP